MKLRDSQDLLREAENHCSMFKSSYLTKETFLKVKSFKLNVKSSRQQVAVLQKRKILTCCVTWSWSQNKKRRNLEKKKRKKTVNKKKKKSKDTNSLFRIFRTFG